MQPKHFLKVEHNLKAKLLIKQIYILSFNTKQKWMLVAMKKIKRHLYRNKHPVSCKQINIM